MGKRISKKIFVSVRSKKDGKQYTEACVIYMYS
jgi:hypothetical protein